MSTLFTTLDIAGSGMTAERLRMNVAAMNLANARSTRTAEGGPYRRRDVVLAARPVEDTFQRRLGAQLVEPGEPYLGVEAAEVVTSDDEPILVYEPGHPDADARGYVAYPNVRPVEEMVNLMGAARAYEAGTTVMRTVRKMAEQAFSIGR
ncbi:MAG: flagellar basal body rod protein FlgC [Deltaproteobacteria bacterium]|nr:MAG: flagellar basal body rod protein FlgC [Deltaproteobacteria bacterium]